MRTIWKRSEKVSLALLDARELTDDQKEHLIIEFKTPWVYIIT